MIKWAMLIPILIVIIVIIFMFPSFQEAFLTEGKNCTEYVCTRTTLDEFDKCVDLGVETVGFMSSEHFYLCDGIKITKTCLKSNYVPTNRTQFALGMRCKKR